MLNVKNRTLYTASFRGLKLQVFGVEKVIREIFFVTIHQVTCRPERWAAHRDMRRAGFTWSAPTADELMKLISADFVETVSPWTAYPAPKAGRPDLRSAADVEPARKKA